jgi:polar amino acid transport system substrate-binding protein
MHAVAACPFGQVHERDSTRSYTRSLASTQSTPTVHPGAGQGGPVHRASFDANQGILVKKGTKVSSLEEAKGLKWGAQLNTTGAAYINDTIKPTSEARLYDRTVDAFTALSAGQIQAVLLDTPIVLGAVKEKQVPDGEVVGQFKTGEQYGAVVNTRALRT